MPLGVAICREVFADVAERHSAAGFVGGEHSIEAKRVENGRSVVRNIERVLCQGAKSNP